MSTNAPDYRAVEQHTGQIRRPSDNEALVQERKAMCIEASNTARDMWLALVNDLIEDSEDDERKFYMVCQERDALQARLDEVES